MKIFIVCSKAFYPKVQPILNYLKQTDHEVTLPNSYHDPGAEERYRKLGEEQHAQWKEDMLRHSINVISSQDALLVLNFEKNGQESYIGGATFMEMAEAFRLRKKIFLLNDIPKQIPKGILEDEIRGMRPISLNGDLLNIRRQV